MKTRRQLRICIFSKAMAAHRGGNFLWPFTLVARQLRDLGHEIVVVTTAHPDGKTTTVHEESVEVHYLRGTRPEKTDRKYWQASARLFDSLHSRHPFDLVMGRGRSSWGYVAESRFGGKVPLISHEGTYPSWLHGYKLKPAGLKERLKWSRALAEAISNRKQSTCLMRSDLVIANSIALADAVSECLWWDPPATRFIPYAFQAKDETQAPLPGDLNKWCMDSDYLVYVGRVTRKKGALDLLRVLHGCRDRNLRLLICGDANRANLQRINHLARKLGIATRVHLAGPVAHDALPRILSGAKAFLFPSIHPESLPKSVMEAMAAGIPVLGYRIPAMAELVHDGKEGFLAEVGDIAGLIEATDRILEDEPLRNRIGSFARERIRADFQQQKVTRMWEDALQSYAGSGQTVAPTFYGCEAGEPA